MKRKSINVVILTVILAVTLTGVGIAAEWAERPDAGPKHRHHRDGGLMILSPYIHQNMTVQVLSEITGKPVDTIREQIEGRRLRTVLDDYQIDRKAFQIAMRSKINALIATLAKDGYITPDQERSIVEKMDRQMQRRDLMKSLIEKGVEDGTITPEQAQLLEYKRH